MRARQDRSSRAKHWERIYSSRSAGEVGWYTPHLETSLDWIGSVGLEPDAAIIDVGGGASTLVDDLLGRGYSAITVLDLAAPALQLIKARLGEKGSTVTLLCGDVTDIELGENAFELWHDRAVFHFLTDAGDRDRYRANLCRALRPGGHVIIGTFAPGAPPRCSGLPVQRYDLDLLHETLGDAFELRRHQQEMHVTPGGVEQLYLYCEFRLQA